MRKGGKWYEGTADAIYHNLWLLNRNDAKHVVVLSGDHIYRMDYAAMVEEHLANQAKLTVACMDVACNEASAFGVMGLMIKTVFTHLLKSQKIHHIYRAMKVAA